MSSKEIDAQPQGLEGGERLRNDGRRGREGDDMGNRTGGRSTAEWAVLEMSVRSRVVVPVVRFDLHLIGRGTHFQQERRTACRHEADRHVGAKQENRQQEAGE